ncbi:VRR-NUC domain protein [compost metagenome]
MPDLIQFWPQHKTYRMIEVKGPGDRLQDNQLRWLEFCHEHQMPVAVCYVQWAESAIASELAPTVGGPLQNTCVSELARDGAA